MSKSSLMSSWMSEFCAPVVMVVPTAEVESISLKNGLLFHDLLRAFSTLDVNETIRSNGNMIHIKEAHIRFERSTEFVAKPPGTVEQLLRSLFQEFDIARLPANASELKSQSPTAWTPQIEQVLCRSMSFSEYEMLSHPIVVITAVSTTDFDVVACMQEMVSYHHVPSIMSAGQYETDVHRVFLIVHDPHAAPTADAPALLKKLQAHFPSSQTKLMVINSNPPTNLNMRQPDLWSRVINPLFFPQHAPLVDEANATIDAQSGAKVYGACLSMEDFITIRDFCLSLYHLEIVPLLERRINNLSKIVADARRGVKNVIKSLWGGGKKKEDAPLSATGLRYRVDRIEAQILLLADTCFIARDYETALTMYKMVREDFKSDKSMVHLAHTCLMGIACNIATDTNRRELGLQLESLSQVMATFAEPAHSHAFFALLASDVYIHHVPQRAPVEAATFLLTAAASCSKLDLTSGLLIERAAQLFLQAGLYRRFIFHEVLSGLKIRACGPRPALHAIFCAACALLMQDEAKWGGLKAKLALLIAGDMKLNVPDSGSQYILLALKAVLSAVGDAGYVTGRSTNIESVAMAALTELAKESATFAPLAVSDDWDKASTFETIQNPYYVFDKSEVSSKGDSAHVPGPLLEVSNLPLPELDHPSVSLMQNSNGYFTKEVVGSVTKDAVLADRLARMLHLEQAWIESCEENLLAHVTTQNIEEFWLKLAEIEFEDQLKYAPEGALILSRSAPELRELQIPLGETFAVRLSLKNPLSTPMVLSDVSLDLSPADAFEVKPLSVTVPPKSSIVVMLQAAALRPGHFAVDRVRWTLREAGLSVRQAIQKPGPLLHKTLPQRAKRERAEDKSLKFEVVPPFPLLALSIDGLSDEILQGQLVLVALTLKNEGSSTATNIAIKSNRPYFMFFTEANTVSDTASKPEYLPFLGPTCTVTRLPASTIIPPGESIVVKAWMRLRSSGKQQISFIASYFGRSASNTVVSFGSTSNPLPRTSFLGAEVR